MEETMETLKHNIIALAIKKRWNIDEIALYTGIHRNTISRIVHKNVKDVRLVVLDGLCNGFEIPVEKLLTQKVTLSTKEMQKASPHMIQLLEAEV